MLEIQHKNVIIHQSGCFKILANEIKKNNQVVKVSPVDSFDASESGSKGGKRGFTFFAPHHLLVQKVQTSSIMQNSGQVSQPPPSRITTPFTFTQ